MIIYLNIDDTVCDMPEGEVDYSLATPIKGNIDKANKMFDEGHQIVYWTDRAVPNEEPYRAIKGSDLVKESRNLRICKETSRDQLKKWNVKFHNIRFDLPNFDVMISDKAKKMLDF